MKSLALVVICSLGVLIAPVASAQLGPTPQAPNRLQQASSFGEDLPAVNVSQDSASVRAQNTGIPVVVDSLTTETSQVTAEPDGLFQLDSNVRPVRVKRDAGWVPVDTVLVAAPDGTVHPDASTVAMSFSGGGSGPLVTLTAGSGAQISYTWPAPLPAPVISGSAATYPGVLPGVDLQLTAGPDNYSEVLIVHNAAAAANPALGHLRLTSSGRGLSVTAGPAGSIQAVDRAGTVVFRGAAPQMWDSTADPRIGPSPSTTDPGSGRIHPLALTVGALTPPPGAATTPGGISSSAVTFSPPAAALTGPGITYPLYIDPSMSGLGSNWADVQSNGISGYDDPTGFSDLKVGLCDFSGCNGSWVSRAYFAVPTTALKPHNTVAKIYSASIYATETHEAVTCLSEPVNLYSTAGGISAATGWPGPASGLLQQVSSADGSNCPSHPANNLIFDNAAVVNYAQTAANAGYDSLTFGLVSANEGNDNYWKRFALNPTLTVKYNFPPSNPTTGAVSPQIVCNGITYVSTSTPTLTGSDIDNNSPALNVSLKFDVYQHANEALAYSSAAVVGGSGTVLAHTLASALPDGTYDFGVSAHNVTTDGTLLQSAASGSAHSAPFTIDTQSPAGTPTASSWDFPASYWGAPAGSGTIHLDDGAATNAAGFLYGYDSPANIPALPNNKCDYSSQAFGNGYIAPDTGGGADIHTPSTLSVGPHTLYFKTFDAAHHLSVATGQYSLYLSPLIGGEGNTRPEAETFPAAAPTFTAAPAGTPSNHCGGTGSTGDTTYPESFPPASGGQDQHLLATCGDPTYGPTFSFTLPSVAVSADYAFGMGIIQANHFGFFQAGLSYPDGTIHYFLDGNANPYLINGYNATSGGLAYQQLGGQHLQAGTYTLILKAVGTSAPAANGYLDPHGIGGPVNDNGYAFDLDYLSMVPINNVTEASFTAALNNNGISPDGTGTGNIGPSTYQSALSLQAMTAAGFGPGATPTVDGIPFTMPTPTNGNDNIIAIGQSIPVPWTPIPVNNIDLLVASTCNSAGSPSNANVLISMNYQDNTHYTAPTNVIPVIPDWSLGNTTPLNSTSSGSLDGNNNPLPDSITKAVTMPYRNAGTTKDTAYQPSLYHLHLPVHDTTQTLVSITLPNIGSDLTLNCKESIHLFAMAHS